MSSFRGSGINVIGLVTSSLLIPIVAEVGRARAGTCLIGCGMESWLMLSKVPYSPWELDCELSLVELGSEGMRDGCAVVKLVS